MRLRSRWPTHTFYSRRNHMWMVFLFVQIVFQIFVLICLINHPPGHWMRAGESLARIELFLFFTSLMQKFAFQSPPWGLPSEPGWHLWHWFHHSTNASQGMCFVPGLGSVCELQPVLGVILWSFSTNFPLLYFASHNTLPSTSALFKQSATSSQRVLKLGQTEFLC